MELGLRWWVQFPTCDDATLCSECLVSLDSTNATLNKQSLNKQILGDKVVGSPPSVETEEDTGFDLAACKNHGQPISVECDSKPQFFIDGFGLCSPTRWQPWDRGVNRSPESKAVLTSIYSLLLQVVVSSVGDPRRVCFELVLGRLKASPFPTKTVDRCRAAIGTFLGVTDSALEVPQGQPFHLYLVARVLKVVGDPDPDAAILVDGNDLFATGVPIGVEEPLPRTPMVFPRPRSVAGSLMSPTSIPLPKTMPLRNYPKKSLRPSSGRRSHWAGCFRLSCRFFNRSMATG